MYVCIYIYIYIYKTWASDNRQLRIVANLIFELCAGTGTSRSPRGDGQGRALSLYN